VRVATAALAADIWDILESLSASPGRSLELRSEKPVPEAPVPGTMKPKPPRGRKLNEAEGSEK
jgi:hypothetical protein